MKKQTAVQYLIEQLFPKALGEEQYYHMEIAKAMEKEQIIDAYAIGKYLNNDDRTFAEQYYAETYGK
jgi:hypothetical protein